MSECYIEEIMLEKCTEKKRHYNMLYPYTAIHYIISGSGYFNGKKLSAGMGFAALKYEYVSYYPDPNDPWTYLWIRIYGDDSKKFFKDLGLNYLAESPYIFRFSKANEILAVYDSYKTNLEKLCDSKRFSGALLRLFLSLHDMPTSKNACNVKNDYLVQATEYIRANFAQDISVDSIASMIGISRSYLRNIFFEAYGMSTREYIINMRMSHAKVLLTKTALAMSAVGMECGYSDVTQFSKIFKKHTGESPSGFRKNFKPFPPELSE